jgi:hypothetical protein
MEIYNDQIIFTAIYIIFGVCGIISNFIVLTLFLCTKKMRQFTNYFFANLSIADVLILIICLPITVTDLYSPDIWFYGFWYCRCYTFIEQTITYSSSMSIIIISVQRYFAVTRPFMVKKKKKMKTILIEN